MLKLCDITKRAKSINKEFDKIIKMSDSKNLKKYNSTTKLNVNHNDIIEICQRNDDHIGDNWIGQLKVIFLDGRHHKVINNFPGSVWSDNVMPLFGNYLTDYHTETSMRMHDTLKIASIIKDVFETVSKIVADSNNTTTDKVNINFVNNSSIQILLNKGSSKKSNWESLTYIRYSDGSFKPARNNLHPLNHSWLTQITNRFNDVIRPLYVVDTKFLYDN